MHSAFCAVFPSVVYLCLFLVGVRYWHYGLLLLGCIYHLAFSAPVVSNCLLYGSYFHPRQLMVHQEMFQRRPMGQGFEQICYRGEGSRMF